MIWGVSMTEATFPGGSKSRVTRAGEHIRRGVATPADLLVVEEWRAAHRAVLNTFQSILRNRTKNTKISVAQRHKRKMTIFDKLTRLPEMQLARMDDVAGCRLIFRSIEELYAFRENFHSARFNHKLRNAADKYDYIKMPKQTGYRGIHDVYEYNVNSEAGNALAGLYIEIQYRTLVQHAWATALRLSASSLRSSQSFSAVIIVTSGRWPWLASCSPGLMSSDLAAHQPHRIERSSTSSYHSIANFASCRHSGVLTARRARLRINGTRFSSSQRKGT